ncbi:alanine/glycine:cation symporter family protein [Actinomyces wuliandei]|uniref:alanine/glycine:cation symporter family protein n=1 Tax=Actinomyces wuliandei TaxID=2057743 RepID=UPI000FDAC8E3|nr:alanine/glycine:cation symporter family protein [Actinomyces wuliandei]
MPCGQLVVSASVLDASTAFLADVSDRFYTQVLAWLLLAAGIYFTAGTRCVQVRLFGRMIATIARSRSNAAGGISAFQAFTVGLASRVGTGNIVGVAIAITLGGPGAVFWMWVVAVVGMATGFVESTLAQMYKVASPDGTFRGGPAYYISRGLGSRLWGSVFAVIITFVFGFAYEATQANAISGALEGTFGVSRWLTAVVLVAITGPVVFRGIRRVARITEWVAPVMALLYAVLAVVILLVNIRAIPGALNMILQGAFGLQEAFYGTAGGITAAVINGVKRGLFSNEAGEGSVPNAAATASTPHPVNQGFIQSFGVFMDTMVVCTATALIVLLSGVYSPDPAVADTLNANTLTAQSVAAVLGPWAEGLMAVVIFVFAYSSLLGNYTYAEINVDFLRRGSRTSGHLFLRAMIVVATFIGSVASLEFVWNLSDIAMGVMAVINIVAIILLGRWAFGALRDWEAQNAAVRQGRAREVRFVATDNPHLPGVLPGQVWSAPDDAPESVTVLPEDKA